MMTAHSAVSDPKSTSGGFVYGVSGQKERNKKKKLRKKASLKRRKEARENPALSYPTINLPPIQESNDDDSDEEILEFECKGPFERFKLIDEEDESSIVKLEPQTGVSLKARTAALLEEEAQANELRQKRLAEEAAKAARVRSGENQPGSEIMSKKKIKRLNRPSVAGLKQMVSRPDVVEMWDVCAKDPLTLIFLKSYRNTVPVPRHWCAKRKYLQGKRGFEKPPFRLPEFIARTGIMEMRQSVQDKDSDKTMKTKMREKIRPKVGRVDIDYHKLHDAFFKYQTKPKLSNHGDLYYEGKEFEIKLKEKKPGNLSDDLRSALGLPSGSGAERYPPPWLIAMQRYGPPPSYPNLKIPGLNAPIPDGCAFGYHPGGWGKPPVDELGRPIYGDVFGNGGNVAGVPPPPPPPSSMDDLDEQIAQGQISYWGELESDEESEGEDDEDNQGMDTDEDDDDKQSIADSDAQKLLATIPTPAMRSVVDMGGIVTPASGLITPSGVTSIVAVGMETPQSNIELRKKTIEEAMEDSTGLVTPSAQLYRVLPEAEVNLQQNALMGSTKLYDVSAAAGAQRGMEVENPRDLMTRAAAARQGGTDSQQAAGLKSGSGSAVPEQLVTSKKYKEFKF